MKTVQFKMPTAKAEDWVRQGHDPEPAPAAKPPGLPLAGPAEPIKRLIIDLPVSLHKRLKLGAVERDQTIGNVIRELIAREFPTT
jgi:hypothetical protein